jgi:glycosyltransferase involved in cell wall biosynthesis
MLEPWALAQRARRKRLALRFYQRGDLARSAAVHETAPAEVESVRALDVRAHIALILHGVDVPADIASSQSQQGSDKLTMLFLSLVHPKKGLLDLVEAWSRLPEHWRLIIAGPDEGGHRAQVESAVSRAGLEGRCLFTGPVGHEEKARLFGSADLIVLPTYSENFGISEALARGTPVLTTQVTPWSELVQTDSGWWIARDPHAGVGRGCAGAAVSIDLADPAKPGARNPGEGPCQGQAPRSRADQRDSDGIHGARSVAGTGGTPAGR